MRIGGETDNDRNWKGEEMEKEQRERVRGSWGLGKQQGVVGKEERKAKKCVGNKWEKEVG